MSSQCGGLVCRNLWGNVGQDDIFFVFAVMFKQQVFKSDGQDPGKRAKS